MNGNEPTSSSPPGSLERFHEVAPDLVMGRRGLQAGYEEVARALFEVRASPARDEPIVLQTVAWFLERQGKQARAVVEIWRKGCEFPSPAQCALGFRADPVRCAGDYTNDAPGGCRMDGDPAHLWS